jgi:hypothetical protein
MSNPSKPEAPPAPPTEGPTKAFSVKMEGWMADLMKDDLDPQAKPAPPASGDTAGAAPGDVEGERPAKP